MKPFTGFTILNAALLFYVINCKVNMIRLVSYSKFHICMCRIHCNLLQSFVSTRILLALNLTRLIKHLKQALNYETEKIRAR